MNTNFTPTDAIPHVIILPAGKSFDATECPEFRELVGLLPGQECKLEFPGGVEIIITSSEWTGVYAKHTAQPAPAAPEPVGEAGTMPGTAGFTMACFHADKVPVGTKLYADRPAPGVPDGWQPIQTAPTDGTKFLGWRRGQVATSYRVPRDDCEMWCFGGTSGAFEHWPETRPEFWMPHPPEPALAAAQAKK